MTTPDSAPTPEILRARMVSRWMGLIEEAYQSRDDILTSAGYTPRSLGLNFVADQIRAEVERLAAQAAPTADRWHDAALPPEIEQRLAPWLTNGAALHPATINLVVRFARALSKKLAAAETKYGYSDGWLSPDWMDECRAKLMEHIAKGDPRDVAAYCAFLWHHGASTIAAQPSQRTPKEVHVQADTIEDIKRAFSELSADKRIPADGKSTSGAQQSKGTPIMTTETATTPNTAAPTVTNPKINQPPTGGATCA